MDSSPLSIVSAAENVKACVLPVELAVAVVGETTLAPDPSAAMATDIPRPRTLVKIANASATFD